MKFASPRSLTWERRNSRARYYYTRTARVSEIPVNDKNLHGAFCVDFFLAFVAGTFSGSRGMPQTTRHVECPRAVSAIIATAIANADANKNSRIAIPVLRTLLEAGTGRKKEREKREIERGVDLLADKSLGFPRR